MHLFFKSASVEGDYRIGKVQINPGVAALNRTLDQNSMDAIVASINAQPWPSVLYPSLICMLFYGI